ncbi:hypothetical protein [Phytohabitans kaempferiae]|uniref:MucB/RseB N-terminal domain-containing protein n=1 Tax=Phytohabitans kaempferiae TaxID=1620943 RepID=A0ABV6LWJ7_9ACTN
MTLSDNDIRTLLHRATDHLTGPPGLLDDIRQGGRRRVVRRRALLTAGLAVTAAASTGGLLRFVGTEGEQPLDPSSPLFAEPTRGDLAGDKDYLRQVRQQWFGLQDPLPDMRGTPHVLWAGSTPAGPAAFIAQRGGTGAAVGWIEPTPDGPRVSSVSPVNEPTRMQDIAQAILLGPERDVLLVLDFGWPVQLSTELRYAPDGKIVRQYQPFAFGDGAGWRHVDRQVRKITVALRRSDGQPGQVFISNASTVLNPEQKQVPVPERFEYTLPGAPLPLGRDETSSALKPYQDFDGTHTQNPRLPRLTIRGLTPDGRRLLVDTIQFDDDPTRVVAMLARGEAEYQAVASGFVDWKAILPVRLRLPDGQGTLVAAPRTTLQHRAGGGRWHDAGPNATLLPTTATEVRVTPNTGPAHTVPL